MQPAEERVEMAGAILSNWHYFRWARGAPLRFTYSGASGEAGKHMGFRRRKCRAKPALRGRASVLPALVAGIHASEWPLPI